MIFPKLLVIFLLLSAPVFAQQAGGEKYALIFAIGNYPPATGWPQISSLQDVGYLRKMLLAQGFPDQHIAVVADTQATINGIRDAFSALTERVHPGDIVVVHFSSHGEQVEADNDNHIDGLDECVVTFNAKSPTRSTDYEKDQADYLRGHVLGDYLRALRAKLGLGGDLLVTMDDCHSGNGTRGLARVRGGAPPLVSAHFDPSRHHTSDSSMLSREAAVYAAGKGHSAGTADQSTGTTGHSTETADHSTGTGGLAPYVVFSATRPEELDNEMQDDETGVYMGSLTYALCKAFAGLSAATGYPSYRQLFARIQSIMNVKVQDQHPMIEGDGMDRLLFGGQFVHQQPYIVLSSVDKATRRVVLKAGKIAGIDQGAEIAICPAGTRDTAGVKPLARGKIVSATDISAIAQLDGDIAINQPVDGWAFVTRRVYSVAPVALEIRSGHGASGAGGTGGAGSVSYTLAEAAAIERALKDEPGVKIVTKNPTLVLVKGPVKDTLKVSVNGFVFATIRPALSDSRDLQEKLQEYDQYIFLQTLSCQVPGVQVDIQLYLRNPDGSVDLAATAARMKGGRLEAHDGDLLTLRIHNNGKQTVYINVLDLQPDGVINPILPNMRGNVKIGPDQLAVPPGGEYSLPADDFIRIGPPYGTEVFKLFASPVEINLENLANTRGGPDPSHPPTMMEQLIRASYRGTRGGDVGSDSQPDAATLDYLFLIKPKP
jgi:metacaspase-1